jgi:hypothetical protein
MSAALCATSPGFAIVLSSPHALIGVACGDTAPFVPGIVVGAEDVYLRVLMKVEIYPCHSERSEESRDDYHKRTSDKQHNLGRFQILHFVQNDMDSSYVLVRQL